MIRGAMMVIVMIMLLTGCSDNNGSDTVENDLPFGTTYPVQEEGDILTLADPGFDAQIAAIQRNPYAFLGRTIRFEGMFLSSEWEDETIFSVARLGGGCCGMHGFEVYLNDFPHFEDETWVEVTGILEEFYVEQANQYFFRLNVTSLIMR